MKDGEKLRRDGGDRGGEDREGWLGGENVGGKREGEVGGARRRKGGFLLPSKRRSNGAIVQGNRDCPWGADLGERSSGLREKAIEGHRTGKHEGLKAGCEFQGKSYKVRDKKRGKRGGPGEEIDCWEKKAFVNKLGGGGAGERRLNTFGRGRLAEMWTMANVGKASKRGIAKRKF